MPRVALSLGSNLGDRARLLDAAVKRLRQSVLTTVRCSSKYETVAEQCEPGARPFLNLAVTGTTGLQPLALLDACRQIETAYGRPPRRERRETHESRYLDIDILLIGREQIRHPRLIVPHPELRQRRFVLQPLAEIAPDWPIPPSGCSVDDALNRLGD